jgi:hypothetical protein
MGSFANSLHIQCEDAAAVAEIIRNALSAEGYELTDEELDEEARWGFSATLRVIHLSAARDGWVSLLDTDMMHSLGLAAMLSEQLEAHALQVMVNDSDSWHYQLYYAGQPIDEFNSSGGEEFGQDGGIPDLEGIFGEGLAELQRSVQERAEELGQRLRQLLPADLQEIQDRWKAGRATQEEIQKYTQWISTEMPRLMGGFKGLLGELAPILSLPGRPPANEGELQPHVVHLRPLVKAGVSEARVREVLGRQAVFAEQTLADFLPLIGIASRYAYLSYRYLDECSAKDLAADSIRLEHHLKFKKLTVG